MLGTVEGKETRRPSLALGVHMFVERQRHMYYLITGQIEGSQVEAKCRFLRKESLEVSIGRGRIQMEHSCIHL